MTGIGTYERESDLGRVTVLTRDDMAIMYLDVEFDVEAVQAGWPEFESRLSSVRGRTMLAVVYPEQRIYRLATAMRVEDDPDSMGLLMGVAPGGAYLRLTLAGDGPGVHGDIGPAFERMRGMGEYDTGRPCLEVYRSPREVDCLLPVRG